MGAQIQFLIADKLLTTVVDEDDRTWKLDSGRVAKKKTRGKEEEDDDDDEEEEEEESRRAMSNRSATFS